ncbi:MAG TPA: aminotransferase class III-fold pyridoxal phosphate-dependent enzyme [Actinomycetota bacterium]|jgi:4-aminobutyrate aminotransferase|nr:aminotransferase class III-fold pyridoxal phosphate-dependent enzyme [Actinomycetota bacterium]
MSTAETTDLAQARAPHLVTEVPGPEALNVIERDGRVTSPSLPRAYPFVPRRGAGSVVEDVDGNLFLDVNAGIAVTSTGHSHPKVVEAIQRQAAELIHYSASDFFLPIYSEVCKRLDQITPVGGPARSFLTNSGTEAVEAALKLARYSTGRQYVIAMYGAFHGRSYGSVSLTASKARYHEGFGPMLPGVLHAFYGDFEYIEKVLFKHLVVPREVAAVVVEPILGEGGYLPPPEGWLAYLRELCDRHGILLVADEVQSGMGRTGRWWAMEHFDVQPDIVLAGKGIASGMPLGAMIAREDLMTWEIGAHGSTYGGNPVACAAALATMDLIEGGLLDNARDVGALFLQGLREIQARHAEIVDVRGVGLMIGVRFPDHDHMVRVEEAAFHRGLLVLGCGDDVIRMAPPLVFRPDQVQTALEVFEGAVAEAATGS